MRGSRPHGPISTIGRTVDPREPSHVAIIVIASAVAAVGGITLALTGAGAVAALRGSAVAGITIFLTWALGRELDPDHPRVAFVGVAVAIGGVALLGVPGLMFALWALLALRVVNRTSGLPATWLDAALVVGIAALLVHQGMWLVGIATAIAFAADAVLQPTHRRYMFFAAAMLIATAVLSRDLAFRSASDPLAVGAFALVGIALLVLAATSRAITSVGDRTGEPLRPQRVQASHMLALVVSVTVLMEGDAGLVTGLPLWAAIIGAGAARVVVVGVKRA